MRLASRKKYLLRIGRPLALAVFAAMPLVSGCFFGSPEKRGSVEDELEVETDLALRTLDSADVANAIPSLAALAENAGRMDEMALRIQTIMLTARTLDEEASLWPSDKATNLRLAARRQAHAALREAEDWRRFEPGSKEAELLAYDARILLARLEPKGEGEIEGLLKEALPIASARGDVSRTTAWQLALCQLQAQSGRLGDARQSMRAARASFAKAMKTANKNDPATEALRVALTEAEGDLAAREGKAKRAEEYYGQALDLARVQRRRGEIKRILVKMAALADGAGDAERAAWYRRRADGVTRMSPASSPATIDSAGKTMEQRP